MSNITPIEIFTGVNDTPTAPNSTTGCNGSFLVRKVNDLIENQNKPTTFWDDTNQAINFYIDTVNGDDANDGLTELTPKQSWEGLLPVIKVKTFTDNWNTYVNIRGEFVGEKDFTQLWSWDGFYAEGFITLQKWENDTDNWTWRVVPEGSTDYLPRKIIRNDLNSVGVFFRHCSVIIDNALNFEDLSIDWNSSCKFILNNSTYNNCLNFVNCNLYDHLYIDCADASDKYFSIYFYNSSFRKQFKIANIGTNQFNFYFDKSTVTINDFLHDKWSTHTFNASFVDTVVTTNNYFEGFVGLNIDDNPDVKWSSWLKQYKSENFFFPTLENGRYKVWIPSSSVRLVEIKASGNGGQGVFNFYRDNIVQSQPLSVSFTSAYETYTVGLNSRGHHNAAQFNIQYHGDLYLDVSNASGLTNVYLQLNFREW